ncbi:hypothetical protein [Dyella solisilvae]|uniref:hypothetical protein n=1 Tax=Dyella solisilvae TaxID=1920168 RepID=UPI0011C07451|nr:hypothetical protein [Dyella solisilvae]
MEVKEKAACGSLFSFEATASHLSGFLSSRRLAGEGQGKPREAVKARAPAMALPLRPSFLRKQESRAFPWSSGRAKVAGFLLSQE